MNTRFSIIINKRLDNTLRKENDYIENVYSPVSKLEEELK